MHAQDERWNQVPTAVKTTRYPLYVAFVASLGGFLFGYDLVIISGAQLFLRDQFVLTPQQFGFATSSALLGCIAGPLLGGASRIGSGAR
jgi:MFS family permease